MKKCIVALIFACVCFLTTYAQPTCKDCIYDLYRMLETYQSKYIDIGNNTYSVKSLYQDKSDSIILAAITKARVFSYGNFFPEKILPECIEMTHPRKLLKHLLKYEEVRINFQSILI